MKGTFASNAAMKSCQELTFTVGLKLKPRCHVANLHLSGSGEKNEPMKNKGYVWSVQRTKEKIRNIK